MILVALRAQLETATQMVGDERTSNSNQLHELRAQIEAMHAAHAGAKAKHEQDVSQLKEAHNNALETELSSLRRSHTLELESMRETLSEALATDAANAIEREQLRCAAEREASRHRLARTLESELKAIAGAMDDGEIQSMWDSHPTLDSIRRRRRGTRSFASLRSHLLHQWRASREPVMQLLHSLSAWQRRPRRLTNS